MKRFISLSVKQNATDLPGVGRAHGKVFQANNIQTCNDLQQWSLQALRKEFGQKHGEMLYNFCRGKDNRPLKMDQERKSVSAEINYGMRFTKVNSLDVNVPVTCIRKEFF